jgi:hypothetical protein
MAPLRSGRELPAGFFLLVLVGAWLGLRCGQLMVTVSSLKTQVTPAVAAANDLRRAQASVAGYRDSLLVQARSGDRDPFRAPSVPSPILTGARRVSSEAAVEAPPVLRAFLFDNVNPSVQISQEGATSEWLHRGDSFRGWTVVDLQSESVRISKGGKSVTLPAH